MRKSQPRRSHPLDTTADSARCSSSGQLFFVNTRPKSSARYFARNVNPSELQVEMLQSRRNKQTGHNTKDPNVLKRKHELPRLCRSQHAAVSTNICLFLLCVSSILSARARRSSSSSSQAKYLGTQRPRPDQLMRSSLSLLLCILQIFQDDKSHARAT